MQLYLEGLLLGVVPVFFVGPVLFTLLHASLRDGFWAGAKVAAGIAASDVCAIALCAAGVGQVLSQRWGKWALELAGGMILVGFAVAMIAGAARPRHVDAPPAKGGHLFAAGFLVNFVNPFVFTFWIGTLGGLAARSGIEVRTVVLFFSGMVTTIFVTDLLKARMAQWLRRHVQGPAASWTQRISGVALGGFGVYLLGSALIDLPVMLAGDV